MSKLGLGTDFLLQGAGEIWVNLAAYTLFPETYCPMDSFKNNLSVYSLAGKEGHFLKNSSCNWEKSAIWYVFIVFMFCKGSKVYMTLGLDNWKDYTLCHLVWIRGTFFFLFINLFCYHPCRLQMINLTTFERFVFGKGPSICFQLGCRYW